MYCIYTELSLLYICTQNNWQSISDWVFSIAYNWNPCPDSLNRRKSNNIITYTESWRAVGIMHNETTMLLVTFCPQNRITGLERKDNIKEKLFREGVKKKKSL